MSKEYIASVLKRLRIESGLTADEVGELVGKSGKTVSGWENARSQPDAEILLELCDIYKVDDILGTFCQKENTILSIKENDVARENLLSNYDLLNSAGKKKLLEYSNDLVDSGNYTKLIPSVVAARSINNDVPIHIEDLPDLSKIESDDIDL